ncbi:MAG: response regulator transcription factor [Nitrospirota bacterium]
MRGKNKKNISIAVVSRTIPRKTFRSVKNISATFPATIDRALRGPSDILIIDDIDIPQSMDSHMRFLVVCDHPKERILEQVKHQKFAGFIKSDISPREMQKAISTVQKGQIWVSRDIIAMVFEEFSKQIKKTHVVWQEFLWSILVSPKPFSGVSVILNNRELSEILSQREKELLEFIYRGLTNKEIADRLFISEKTVKTHLYNIYRKLNVSRRTEAISLLLQGH